MIDEPNVFRADVRVAQRKSIHLGRSEVINLSTSFPAGLGFHKRINMTVARYAEINAHATKSAHVDLKVTNVARFEVKAI